MNSRPASLRNLFLDLNTETKLTRISRGNRILAVRISDWNIAGGHWSRIMLVLDTLGRPICYNINLIFFSNIQIVF